VAVNDSCGRWWTGGDPRNLAVEMDDAANPHPDHPRTQIAVGICTYHRNEELQRLLDTVIVAAAAVSDLADVGVVVVDDSKEAMAREVVASFEGRFALGIHYRNTASSNIATARNAVLEGGVAFAEWIAMVDDDGTVSEGWLREYVIAQRRFGADILSGPIDFVPDGPTPSWLDEEFLGWTDSPRADGSLMDTAYTANSFISAERLRAQPQWRFVSDYGELGGEDMIFFRSAFRDGAKIVYAQGARSTEVMNAKRIRYWSQVRAHTYVGNSDSLVHLHLQMASRGRLIGRGGRKLLRAVGSEATRLRTTRRVRPRAMVWHMGYGVGLISGALGVKIKHKGY
jgi:succinoglycan biosynthesis protein ExoM